MRVLGLLGMLLALVVVGMLVKRQLTQLAVPSVQSSQTSAGSQSQPTPAQLQSKIQEDLKAAMQQARPASDDE